MGDHLRMGKPSQYVASHSSQLSLAIPLWVDTVSIGKSWGVNRHTAWFTSPISVVSQRWSGWGLRKWRSALPHGPCGSGRTLLSFLYSFYWTHLRAMGHHLPHGITQFYLPPEWPDTSERAPLSPQPGRLVLHLPTLEGWKAELTWVVWLNTETVQRTHAKQSLIQVLTEPDIISLIETYVLSQPNCHPTTITVG